MNIYLATAAAIVGTMIVGVIVWWLEEQRRKQERLRFLLDERASRDPGCLAWSAWMAYQQTHGAAIFGFSSETNSLGAAVEARLVEQAQTRLLRSVSDEVAS